MGQGESKKRIHQRGAHSAAVEIGAAMSYFPEGNGLGWTKSPGHLKAQELQELEDILKTVVCTRAK